MTPSILVINAGSSSIKFAVFAAAAQAREPALLRGQIENLGATPHFIATGAENEKLADEPLSADVSGADHEHALVYLLTWIDRRSADYETVAVGHRVVHGGDHYAEPVPVDDRVLATLHALVPLAPLHQPHNLAAIQAIKAHRPALPQVACFDTAFHRTQSDLVRAYALPRDLTDQGIKRYGFHGLSYESIAAVLQSYLGKRADGRVIVAHLGNGASLCAMRHRNSVATTMGFTALDGLVMGTRSGSIDPGVLLYLLDQGGYTPAGLADLLYYRSGLLGVSALSHDMRVLLASSDPRAGEAIDLFVYRIGRELGSLAAALGGLDALVFTAGIGENAAPIRAKICEAAAWLGVALDREANAKAGPRISRPNSKASAWVIGTNEEGMIAAHTARLLNLR